MDASLSANKFRGNLNREYSITGIKEALRFWNNVYVSFSGYPTHPTLGGLRNMKVSWTHYLERYVNAIDGIINFTLGGAGTPCFLVSMIRDFNNGKYWYCYEVNAQEGASNIYNLDEFALDTYVGQEVNIEVAFGNGTISYFSINGVIQGVDAGGFVSPLGFQSEIGRQLGNTRLLRNGAAYNFKFRDSATNELYYSIPGNPAGDTNAAWDDEQGNFNGTVHTVTPPIETIDINYSEGWSDAPDRNLDASIESDNLHANI